MKPAALVAGLRILSTASILVLGGCVVPIKESAGTLDGQRANLGEQVPDFIVEGQTTREDVLLTLGEPDGSGADDRWLLYRTGRSLGGVSLLAVIPAPSHGAIGEIAAKRTLVWSELILHFDEQGIVRKAELIDQRDQRTHWLPGERWPAPPLPRLTPVPPTGPTALAHRDAVRTFVPAERDERLLEGFIAAACQVEGHWHDALAFVTNRAVYCWIPAQADGNARQVLLRWAGGEIDEPEWAPTEVAPERPAVQLRRGDGTTALFAFYSLEASEPMFDRARALLFLESLRYMRDAALRK